MTSVRMWHKRTMEEVRMLQNRCREVNNILLQKGPPFSLGVSPYYFHLAGCQRKDVSQCQRLLKRIEIIYLKVIQT